jgi:hypothetical protein
MIVDGDKLCPAYDQISDRTCRYYADHGGGHNFARLDHDCALERKLRQALDEMTAARDELANIAEGETLDETYSPSGVKRTLARIAELREVGAS